MKKGSRIGRWLRGIGTVLVLFLLLLGIGRLGQIYLQSQYHGERAPYLQMVGHDRAMIRWQSSEAEPGVVRYRRADTSDAEVQVVELGAAERHQITLSGLQPDTRYSYRVGRGDKMYYGAEQPLEFVTAPPPGSNVPLRLWVQGDPGYFSHRVEEARDGALQWMEGNPYRDDRLLDLILTTGDNAYTSGKNSEFQKALFEPFGDLISRYPYWPVYGNHDARRWTFFNIFTFPEGGELGGVPSGTEHYYSIDYGPVHLIFLDSESSGLGNDDEMAHWLIHDLTATDQPWRIVLLHHPPYTRGTHNSDDSRDSWGRMTAVRENIVPILERAGVDLLLAGHSHVYERSHLLNCHYGLSKDLEPSMVLDRDSEFDKQGDGANPHSGVAYVVVGATSHAQGGPLNHPAMAVSKSELGSLLIDIDGLELKARYINSSAQVSDYFSIIKGGHGTPSPGGPCKP